MAKFYICVGPPCSGKSTWAKELANKNPDVMRINRDDLRTMFRGGYVHGQRFTEALCTTATMHIAGEVLRAGFDVVLDNTNCNPGTVASIMYEMGRLKGQGIDVQVVFKVFEIPYWKQRWRNYWRWYKGQGPWIPAKVSKTMHENFQKVKTYINDNLGGLVSSGS